MEVKNIEAKIKRLEIEMERVQASIVSVEGEIKLCNDSEQRKVYDKEKAQLRTEKEQLSIRLIAAEDDKRKGKILSYY